MRNLFLLTLLVAIPTVLSAQDDDDEWLDNCRSMRENGRPTACAVVVKTLPARGLLKLRPGQNGAVKIIAHEAADIEVHARH